MTAPNLNESAWQRAAAAAGRVYPSTEFEVAAALMTIIAGAIAAVTSASENTTTQIAVPILGGAVALLMTFAVVFGFQLIAAPVRQRNELRTAWEAPETETVNVGLTLGNMHRKGTELVHRFAPIGIGRPEEEEIEQWADEVVAFLAKHAPEASTQTFIAAGESESGPVLRLNARLQALQQIIDSLG